MKIFVLSMDTEIGQKRRNLLNYDYEWIRSVDCPENLKSKFKLMYNISDQKKKNIQNCFASHLHVMETIIKRKIDNCVVCEDDAFLVNDVPELDQICLLSGRLHHPKNWKDYRDWRKYVRPLIDFEKGINTIDYDTYRWTGFAAVYYPTWQKVLELYNKINQSQHYKHFDILIAEHQLINHLYYPSPFAAIDCVDDKFELSKITSQVAGGQGIVYNYKMYGRNKELLDKLKSKILKN